MAGLFNSAATFKRCVPEKISYLALNLFDLFLTVYALSCGLSELNPLMRYLVTVPIMLVVVKVFIPLLIAWLAPGRLLLPATGLLLVVVCWNIKEMVLFLL